MNIAEGGEQEEIEGVDDDDDDNGDDGDDDDDDSNDDDDDDDVYDEERNHCKKEDEWSDEVDSEEDIVTVAPSLFLLRPSSVHGPSTGHEIAVDQQSMSYAQVESELVDRKSVCGELGVVEEQGGVQGTKTEGVGNLLKEDRSDVVVERDAGGSAEKKGDSVEHGPKKGSQAQVGEELVAASAHSRSPSPTFMRGAPSRSAMNRRTLFSVGSRTHIIRREQKGSCLITSKEKHDNEQFRSDEPSYREGEGGERSEQYEQDQRAEGGNVSEEAKSERITAILRGKRREGRDTSAANIFKMCFWSVLSLSLCFHPFS